VRGGDGRIGGPVGGRVLCGVWVEGLCGRRRTRSPQLLWSSRFSLQSWQRYKSRPLITAFADNHRKSKIVNRSSPSATCGGLVAPVEVFGYNLAHATNREPSLINRFVVDRLGKDRSANK